MEYLVMTVDALHPGAVFLFGLVLGWFIWG